MLNKVLSTEIKQNKVIKKIINKNMYSCFLSLSKNLATFRAIPIKLYYYIKHTL